MRAKIFGLSSGPLKNGCDLYQQNNLCISDYCNAFVRPFLPRISKRNPENFTDVFAGKTI